jgi:hypothetical protein
MDVVTLNCLDGELYTRRNLVEQAKTLSEMLQPREGNQSAPNIPVPLSKEYAELIFNVFAKHYVAAPPVVAATSSASAATSASASTPAEEAATVPVVTEWKAPELLVLDDFSKEFASSMPIEKLFDIINASFSLDYDHLKRVTTRFVASMLDEMTVEQIREKFEIEDDFSPEEKEQIEREKKWVEEHSAPASSSST